MAHQVGFAARRRLLGVGRPEDRTHTPGGSFGPAMAATVADNAFSSYLGGLPDEQALRRLGGGGWLPPQRPDRSHAVGPDNLARVEHLARIEDGLQLAENRKEPAGYAGQYVFTCMRACRTTARTECLPHRVESPSVQTNVLRALVDMGYDRPIFKYGSN